MRNIIFAITICFLASCQSNFNNGQIVTNQDLASINESHPSKEELVDMIGMPTYVPHNEEGVWYYINRLSSKSSFTSRRLIEQRVVRVKFLGNNVASASLLDDVQCQDLNISNNQTEAIDESSGTLSKFVNNFGRFRGAKPKKVENKAPKESELDKIMRRDREEMMRRNNSGNN